MAAKAKILKTKGRSTQRIMSIDSLSKGGLKALAKLAIARRILMPSSENYKSYEEVWRAGYAYAVGGGFIINLDQPQKLMIGAGIISGKS